MIQVIDFETTGLTDPQPVQYAEVLIPQHSMFTSGMWGMEKYVINLLGGK